jgi:hypothetical protein
METHIRSAEPRDQRAHGVRIVADDAVLVDGAVLISDGDGDGGCMGIEPDKPRTLTHGTGLHAGSSVRDVRGLPAQPTTLRGPVLPC